MEYVGQSGCHFLSGEVLIGDPMFGRNTEQVLDIQQIKVGYWHIVPPVDNHKNQQRFKSLNLFCAETREDKDLKIQAVVQVLTVSGYIGIFDEKHFQAGHISRCQQWFDYCSHSIDRKKEWSTITGGVILRLDGYTEWCLSSLYADRNGNIRKIELSF